MTGKGRELADMMKRRNVDVLCVQETQWKGSKARNIGRSFKLFYYRVDSRRNGVDVVIKEDYVKNVVEVKRVSDRVMSVKFYKDDGLASRLRDIEKEFWENIVELMDGIPKEEF
ncbi:uncharacterized protein LOC122253709 [Penaeus japonicus]|uniref:uncharacterized protein LOC122253709 n=1 Tax=Penaeus japonicus TaxID=27405 RepID=UPI001C70ED93|nr:uncharacterized protein LOC122253709 [Penaeus japonicus]